LRGAGYLLRLASKFLPSLRHYPLKVQGIGIVPVDLSDDSGMAWLNYSLGDRLQEEGVLTFIAQCSPLPRCIWDVGANGGYFGAQVAEMLPMLDFLYLFEPNPALHEMLDVVARSRKGIFYHPFALTDKNGKATISLTLGNSPTASLIPISEGRKIDVDVKTGDAFLAEYPEAIPDLLIIDVEGAERNVLMGIQNMLKQHRPIVIFEQIFFDPSILDVCMPNGYTRFTIDDNTGKLIPGYNLKAGHNGVFLYSEDAGS